MRECNHILFEVLALIVLHLAGVLPGTISSELSTACPAAAAFHHQNLLSRGCRSRGETLWGNLDAMKNRTDASISCIS